MKHTLSLSILLLVITFLPSCQKEEVFTDQEKIEYNLRRFVIEHDIKTCSIIFLGETQNINGPEYIPFEIRDGFLIIKEKPYIQYNLLHVLSFYQYDQNINLIFSR